MIVIDIEERIEADHFFTVPHVNGEMYIIYSETFEAFKLEMVSRNGSKQSFVLSKTRAKKLINIMLKEL